MSNVNYFLKSGGKVLGENGPFELGRLVRSPSVPKRAYLRGNAALLHAKPTVGIVGTRKPSALGLKRAFDYAATLTNAGCLIVSGGALGIDYAAHRGALSVGGETLSVLGDPVFENRDERPRRILDLAPSELVTTVTTYGPGTKLGKTLFVARNQYIAALSDAIVIIEGMLNSGTLHTARYAAKIGVPVWAIPGDPDNPLAEAANFLLASSDARPLLNTNALIESLGLNIAEPTPEPAVAEGEGEIWEAFKSNNGRVTLDLLCEMLKVPIFQIQSDLLELELMGTIQREGAEFVWQNRSLS
ncbi:MAG: DNA-processing protein DprA [Myxococcota bacterium]